MYSTSNASNSNSNSNHNPPPTTHHFTILFTSQKTQKSKRWQDGTLVAKYPTRLPSNSSRPRVFCTLYDEDRNLKESFSQIGDVAVGDEIETEMFLVTVEARDKAVVKDSGHSGGPSSSGTGAVAPATPVRMGTGVFKGSQNTGKRIEKPISKYFGARGGKGSSKVSSQSGGHSRMSLNEIKGVSKGSKIQRTRAKDPQTSGNSNSAVIDLENMVPNNVESNDTKIGKTTRSTGVNMCGPFSDVGLKIGHEASGMKSGVLSRYMQAQIKLGPTVSPKTVESDDQIKGYIHGAVKLAHEWDAINGGVDEEKYRSFLAANPFSNQLSEDVKRELVNNIAKESKEGEEKDTSVMNSAYKYEPVAEGEGRSNADLLKLLN